MIVLDIATSTLYDDALPPKGPTIVPVPAILTSLATKLLDGHLQFTFDADASHHVAIFARAQRRKHGIPETGIWRKNG